MRNLPRHAQNRFSKMPGRNIIHVVRKCVVITSPSVDNSNFTADDYQRAHHETPISAVPNHFLLLFMKKERLWLCFPSKWMQ